MNARRRKTAAPPWSGLQERLKVTLPSAGDAHGASGSPDRRCCCCRRCSFVPLNRSLSPSATEALLLFNRRVIFAVTQDENTKCACVSGEKGLRFIFFLFFFSVCVCVLFGRVARLRLAGCCMHVFCTVRAEKAPKIRRDRLPQQGVAGGARAQGQRGGGGRGR